MSERQEIPEEQRLTLKVWETPLGYWAFAVYEGDGSVPGSLKAAAGAMESPRDAMTEGLDDLHRWIKIRSWYVDLPTCTECGICNWEEVGS